MDKRIEQYKFDFLKAGALLIQSSHKASNNDVIRNEWNSLNNFLAEHKSAPESIKPWKKQLSKLRKNLQHEIKEQKDVTGLIPESNRLSELAYSNISAIIAHWNV